MDRGRLEAFSDGVFAVAITLLALDLTVRGPGYGPLASQLGEQWPRYVAYVISFFTIGVIWVNHHSLVSNIKVVSRPLLFLNLLLLMFVVLMPFATSTVAEYLAHGGFDAKVAVAVYAGASLGMGVSFASMLEWSMGEGHAHVPVPRDRRWVTRLQFASGGVVYLAVIGIAFYSALLAFIICGVVGVYYIFNWLPGGAKPDGDRPPDGSVAPED